MNKRKPRKKGYYICKYGILFLAVFIVLGYACLHIWFYAVYKNFETRTLNRFYYFKENMEQILQKGTFKQKEALVDRFLQDGYEWESDGLAISSSASKAYVFDNETGEIVSGKERLRDIGYTFSIVNAMMPKEAYGSMTYAARAIKDTFYCEWDSMKDYLDPAVQRMEYWKEHMPDMEGNYDHLEVRSQLDAFYYRNSDFLPAKISIYCVQVKSKAGFLGEKQYLEEIDIELPELSGYTLYVIDNETENVIYPDILNSLIWHDSEEYQEQQEKDQVIDMDEVSKRALETIEKIAHKGGLENVYAKYGENPLFPFLSGKTVFARDAIVFDAAGHAYRIALYEEKYVSLLSLLFTGNMYSVSILLLFCIMGTILFAELEYRKKRYVYMTEGFRDMLVDSMAHDLKSPLMAISGYAENLKENLAESNLEKSGYYAEKVFENVTYLNSIVTKNLEILRCDYQIKKLARREVDLRQIFEGVIERYQAEIQKRKLTFRIDGEMKPKGDEELLLRVAENLVTNAIRYSSEGSEVLLVFSKNQCIIQNETDIVYQGKPDRLWEPFERGDESRAGKGTGLGLAIVSSILDRHKWKYRIRFDKEKKLFVCIIRI